MVPRVRSRRRTREVPTVAPDQTQELAVSPADHGHGCPFWYRRFDQLSHANDQLGIVALPLRWSLSCGRHRQRATHDERPSEKITQASSLWTTSRHEWLR